LIFIACIARFQDIVFDMLPLGTLDVFNAGGSGLIQPDKFLRGIWPVRQIKQGAPIPNPGLPEKGFFIR
jgi:hypothetical protein